MTLQSLSQTLSYYDFHEARSIIRILLEDCFNLSYTDMLTGGIDRLSDSDKEKLHDAVRRLQQGEPVQYVTGKAWFCGRSYHVEPGILIPRPETEELCQWIIEDGTQGDILDIGTGSGCIAITLQQELPHSTVTALDISDDALCIAQSNATSLHADINFRKQDALSLPSTELTSPGLSSTEPASFAEWDAIVSNPPYICHQESADMERNVLGYEPSLALFVPDEDPLLFYRSIAEYAIHALRYSGSLYFEINPLFAKDLSELLSSIGFSNITLREDTFGKQRMIKCTRL